MKLDSIRFLRSGNVVSSHSGAVICLSDLDPASRIVNAQLSRWLACLPTTLQVVPVPSELSLVEAIQRLLVGLSEQARLHADPNPLRLLSQGPAELCLWLLIDDRHAAEAVTRLTCHILSAVGSNSPPSPQTTRLWLALRSRFWNQTHAHLGRAAEQLGVPFQQFDRDGLQFLQLGHGCRSRLCRETVTDRTAVFAHSGNNKESLHRLLQHRGVPLPAQRLVASVEQALEAAESIGWPVVLKPADAAKGKGVWVSLSGPEALRQAWQANSSLGAARQLVQQQLSGADHRLLVVDGVLMAAAQRQPAALISDGQRPLREQIAALNADPQRGVGYERLMNRVSLDDRLTLLLSEQGFSLDCVAPEGTRVQLSRTANISQGGTAIDCSERVHPDNRRLAEDIACLIGADVVGLDLISADIGVSWSEGGTCLLEANLSPGLRPHLVADPDSDLCRRIVRRWVGAGPRAGRIPIALITGSIGKTTTSRLLAHLLHTTGVRVGLCSSTGMELDGRVLLGGDLSGGGPALQLLQDRRVEALVAEIARGGVLQAGIGIPRVDAAAVLNVLDNHVGLNGIRSREDLARIKAVVAAAAEGLLVLNADDPLVLAMGRQRSPSELALVCRLEEGGSAAHAPAPPPAWVQHRAAGHVVASYSMQPQGSISLEKGAELLLSLPLREIPGSDDGCIGSMAAAAAFAACLAHGLGLTPAQIDCGLRSFGLHRGHRNGRFELLIDTPWTVVLCWADGPEAVASLADYALASKAMQAGGRRLLLLSAPDNRPDAFLRRVGQATRGFDLVLTAAWNERRGRDPREVPALLAEGVRSLGDGAPAVLELGLELKAVARLGELLQPGDICLVSSFATEAMRQRLQAVLATH